MNQPTNTLQVFIYKSGLYFFQSPYLVRMKYFLHLAYKGTNYHGWQRQEKVASVQATIEDDLRKLFHKDLTIHGCGRTDAGVHASNYYAHFKVEKIIDFDLVYKLNRMLPDDIVVYRLLPVVEKANAQLDVIQRTYDYQIHLEKDPFLVDKSACYDMLSLDLQKMQTATNLFTNYTDFRYFCLQPDAHNHTRCQLQEAAMRISENKQRIHFRFTADRFLRAMIRLIVARILDVGRGQISLAELQAGLEKEKPLKFINQAYPQGLYLSEVIYPEKIFTQDIKLSK